MQAVRELVRVTRPGGRICLVEPDWSSMRVHGVPGDLIRRVVASITEAGVSMCGSMGRTLAARLSEAGASNVVADPVLVQMDDYEQAVTLLPAFDLRHDKAFVPKRNDLGWDKPVIHFYGPEGLKVEVKVETPEGKPVAYWPKPQLVERVGKPIFDSVTISRQKIEVTTADKDNSVWGVAMWEDVDPELDFFSVYVGGMTNAYKWTAPAGASKT